MIHFLPLRPQLALRFIVRSIHDAGQYRPACLARDARHRCYGMKWILLSRVAERGNEQLLLLLVLPFLSQFVYFVKIQCTLGTVDNHHLWSPHQIEHLSLVECAVRDSLDS